MLFYTVGYLLGVYTRTCFANLLDVCGLGDTICQYLLIFNAWKAKNPKGVLCHN